MGTEDAVVFQVRPLRVWLPLIDWLAPGWGPHPIQLVLRALGWGDCLSGPGADRQLRPDATSRGKGQGSKL